MVPRKLSQVEVLQNHLINVVIKINVIFNFGAISLDVRDNLSP